jgi:5-formyltetrahydrofolate cyclo-ligase
LFIPANPSIADLKDRLRRTCRAIRRQISLAERNEAAERAASHLVKHALFQESQHIACYLQTKEEIATNLIIQAIWQANKKCYLPVMAQTAHPSLLFVAYQEGHPLQANRYGILEPINSKEVIEAAQLELVVMPLVGFDEYGHRLGAGGGYYDSAFAFTKKTVIIKPKLVGLGFAKQQIAKVPVDTWDVTLDGIVTENGVMIFK